MKRTIWAGLAIGIVTPAAAQMSDPRATAERVVSIAGTIGAEGPIWLPDGSRILYASSLGGSAIWSIAPTGGPVTRVTRELSTQLVRLSPSGGDLAYLSDKSGNPEVWVWSLARGEDRQLTRLGARINAMSWSPDGQWIAFSALRYGQFDIWKVRVADGSVWRLTDDPRYDTYPIWTPDGRHIIYVRSDDRWADHELIEIGASGEAPRVIVKDTDLFDYGTMGARSRFGYPVISPDGRQVLFRSHRSGWINYWAVSVEGGAPRALAPESADQSDARWSPDGSQVAWVSTHNGTADIRVGGLTAGVPRLIGPIQFGVASRPEWSPDGKRIAFTLATPTRPEDLQIVAVAGGPVAALTQSIDPAVERGLVVPEKVSYRSDEFVISAYLYRPPGLASGSRAPGIMYIHGGPTGQFSDAFQAQPEFLALQGYVVLAPNIRGSSGYGKRFEDANNPCWTHCDLRDVVAGAEFLKAVPGVDSSRIGITGNSYGGIMSMGAVAHAPREFQAAAAQSGYADWISFQEYNTELQHAKLLAYEWGPYPDSAAVYRRNSSIFSADSVLAPVFLLHGTGGFQSWRPGVLPIPASLEFAHALDRRNKVVRYKTYPGESYYVTGRENSRQVLLDLLEFFDLYLRDGVAGSSR